MASANMRCFYRMRNRADFPVAGFSECGIALPFPLRYNANAWRNFSRRTSQTNSSEDENLISESQPTALQNHVNLSTQQEEGPDESRTGKHV